MIGEEKTENQKEKKADKNYKLESIMDVSKELGESHKYHGDEDILINSNVNSLNIKRDLLLFKDEILKDLKRQNAKIIEKTEDNEKFAMDKIQEFNSKIQKYGEQINSLSNMIVTDKTIREQVEKLIEYKQKNQELVMTNGIQIKNLDKDLFNNVYRIDNILKETVIYPGVIGGISKFRTFHDFMDYVIKECDTNITFREKTSIDINNLRKNDDKIMQNFNIKLEKTKKALTLYVDTCIKKVENKINDLYDLFIDKLNTYHIENMSYGENMKKATDSLLKQVNSVIQAKNDIFNKFDEKMNLANKENKKMIKYFTGYKNEFNEMRRVFKEMLEALNTKDFSGVNRKIKRITRRSTMINNDINTFENNLKNINNVVHPISMTDMFMSEGKNKKNALSTKSNNIVLGEKEKSTPYQIFLREYRRIDTESRRINRFFEKEDTFIEKKKKNDDLKSIINQKEKTKEKGKKKHKKKTKFLNEIYLSFKNQNNAEFITRKLSKYNSICVPNKKFGLNILQKVLFENVKSEKSQAIRTLRIGNSNTNNINKQYKGKKKLNLNEVQENPYETSVSQSQNSIFSSSSENSMEVRKNIIKTKYKTNVIIPEKKEYDKSSSINGKEIFGQDKIEYDKKELIDEKEKDYSITNINSIVQNNIYEDKKEKIKSEQKQNLFNYANENDNLKEQKNDNKIGNEKKKEISNSLNKIYITIGGNNSLEINPNSTKNSQNTKNIISNVKTIINNKMGKTLTGFPKIVTNNGERIIVSSHPIYKKQKFNSYTNPNILALNYSIHNLYENNNKMNNSRKNKIEMNSGYIFQNKQILSKIKKSQDSYTDRDKKVTFNIFKSSNLSNNNFYITQPKTTEDNKLK